MHLKQGGLPFRNGLFGSGTVFNVRERSLPFWDIHECSRKKTGSFCMSSKNFLAAGNLVGIPSCICSLKFM